MSTKISSSTNPGNVVNLEKKIPYMRVSGVLNEQRKRLPSGILKEFEMHKDSIITQVLNILNSSNGKTLETITRETFETWVYKTLKPITFTRYMSFMWKLGIKPIDFEAFSGGNSKLDPEGKTARRRFTIIEQKGIGIGDMVVDNSGRNYEVIGITANLGLMLKGDNRLRNPIEFTKLNSNSTQIRKAA